MSVHLIQAQVCPHGRARGMANEGPETLRFPGKRALGCGLERDEDQCPNHGKGEQRRLDGVNEIHGTNFAGKATPPALLQRTCSQSVGDAGLRCAGFSRLEAPQRFASTQGGDSREESLPFLHLPQRLDVSRAFEARDPVPVLDRGGSFGGF